MSELQKQNLSLWWSVRKFELMNKIFKLVKQFKFQMSSLALVYSLYFSHRYEWTTKYKTYPCGDQSGNLNWWTRSSNSFISLNFRCHHFASFALAYSLYVSHRYEWTSKTKLIPVMISQEIWTDERDLQTRSSVQISGVIILPHLHWHTVYMSATDMSELQK